MEAFILLCCQALWNRGTYGAIHPIHVYLNLSNKCLVVFCLSDFVSLVFDNRSGIPKNLNKKRKKNINANITFVTEEADVTFCTPTLDFRSRTLQSPLPLVRGYHKFAFIFSFFFYITLKNNSCILVEGWFFLLS